MNYKNCKQLLEEEISIRFQLLQSNNGLVVIGVTMMMLYTTWVLPPLLTGPEQGVGQCSNTNQFTTISDDNQIETKIFQENICVCFLTRYGRWQPAWLRHYWNILIIDTIIYSWLSNYQTVVEVYHQNMATVKEITEYNGMSKSESGHIRTRGDWAKADKGAQQSCCFTLQTVSNGLNNKIDCQQLFW